MIGTKGALMEQPVTRAVVMMILPMMMMMVVVLLLLLLILEAGKFRALDQL